MPAVTRQRAIVRLTRTAVNANEVSVNIGNAQRFAPGIAELHEEFLYKAAFQRHLHRVVVRAATHLVNIDISVSLIGTQQIRRQSKLASEAQTGGGICSRQIWLSSRDHAARKPGWILVLSTV